MVERRGRLQQKGGLELKVAEPEDSGPGASTGKAAGFFAEGSRFGAYVIGSCIGHGGMARIYRAEHEGLRRQVALKVLTDGVEPGTEGRARFLREARIAAAIKHPNVVNIFDIGVENKVPYLVMELLVGQDLETLLASHGALSEHTIIDVLIPVVAGLVAVHDAGIVHRDLKPGNIFLSRGPNEEIEPKLLDFGISRSSTAGENMRLTSTRGLLMGTPLYMSPEALLGADMTPLSDQYSLGVVLYECATGVNPFISGSVAETARRVTTGQYTPIADQPIRPSRRLQMIIERAMSLEPSKRFPDMRAFGQELLTLAGQRTRITWGLTFGAVATAARANTRDIETGAVALARTHPPKQGRRVQAWPMFAAAAAGVVTMVALFAWSAKRDAIRGEAVRSDALHGDRVHTVDAKTIASGPPSAKSPVAGAGGSTGPLMAAALPSAPAVVPAPVVPASAGSPSAVPSSSVTPSSAAQAAAGAQPQHVAGPAPSPVPAQPTAAEVEAARAALLAEEARREQEARDRAAAELAAERAREAQRPRAPEPAASPAPGPAPAEAPEWIIERSGRRRAPAALPSERGTNNAFIFD